MSSLTRLCSGLRQSWEREGLRNRVIKSAKCFMTIPQLLALDGVNLDATIGYQWWIVDNRTMRKSSRRNRAVQQL